MPLGGSRGAQNIHSLAGTKNSWKIGTDLHRCIPSLQLSHPENGPPGASDVPGSTWFHSRFRRIGDGE